MKQLGIIAAVFLLSCGGDDCPCCIYTELPRTYECSDSVLVVDDLIWCSDTLVINKKNKIERSYICGVNQVSLHRYLFQVDSLCFYQDSLIRVVDTSGISHECIPFRGWKYHK